MANFRDASGRWRPIDTRLVRRGGRFANRAGPVDVSFAGQTGSGDLFVARKDGWSLGFSLEGARSGRLGEAEGSRIRYRDVATGVDLEERVERDGVKEFVVLNEPLPDDVDARFRFPLSLSGLTPRVGDDGGIVFADAAGRDVAQIPPGVAFDSAPGTPARVPVAYRLLERGGRWVVEVEVTRHWLDDAARV